MRYHKIIAVDFDGVLCEDAYPAIGEAINHNITKIKKEQRDGTQIILWTCRCGDFLDAAVEWCKEQGLHFDAVNANIPEMVEKYGNDCRKVFADEYWDDRAVLIF